MKIIAFIASLATGALLLYGTLDMPEWGDPDSPASRHVSSRYITNALADTATPNTVTAVLGDYRGYDTMGETAVIFSAGIACIFLLKRRRKRKE